jgi:hypothetical protein
MNNFLCNTGNLFLLIKTRINDNRDKLNSKSYYCIFRRYFNRVYVAEVLITFKVNVSLFPDIHPPKLFLIIR